MFLGTSLRDKFMKVLSDMELSVQKKVLTVPYLHCSTIFVYILKKFEAKKLYNKAFCYGTTKVCKKGLQMYAQSPLWPFPELSSAFIFSFYFTLRITKQKFVKIIKVKYERFGIRTRILIEKAMFLTIQFSYRPLVGYTENIAVFAKKIFALQPLRTVV